MSVQGDSPLLTATFSIIARHIISAVPGNHRIPGGQDRPLGVPFCPGGIPLLLSGFAIQRHEAQIEVMSVDGAVGPYGRVVSKPGAMRSFPARVEFPLDPVSMRGIHVQDHARCLCSIDVVQWYFTPR